MANVPELVASPVARFVLAVTALISAAACAQPESGDATFPSDFSGTKVVLLGTGTPTPDPDRQGPAVAVVVDGKPYLVDAGPGVVRQATAAYEKGVRALHPVAIDVAFITHLHSDHTTGLPDLIFTPWVVGRYQPLELYGPPGIKAMAGHILDAYKADIRIRTEGLEENDPRGAGVNPHEIEAGEIYKDDRVTVTAISVDHGSWEHAFGYRFDANDRSIVISGDTAWSDNLIEKAKGCDVLVHEVYCAADFAMLAPEPRKYHGTFHTSAIELGKIAAEVKPKLVVLYHQLGWSPPEKYIEEVKQNFDGEVVYGNDLDVF